MSFPRNKTMLVQQPQFNSYNAELFLHKPWTPKVFLQFIIVINVSVSSFRCVRIPMLWVNDHLKYLNLKYLNFSAGTVFIRQNLTSTDVRFWRIKTVPALEVLEDTHIILFFWTHINVYYCFDNTEARKKKVFQSKVFTINKKLVENTTKIAVVSRWE